MACTCKLKERFPLNSAMMREECILTASELIDMRIRKGMKPVRIGY